MHKRTLFYGGGGGGGGGGGVGGGGVGGVKECRVWERRARVT